MLARHRYRAYPTQRQAPMLAATFGCAPVVFNDALRTRQDAHAAGDEVSDTEVQRRVITLAKTTPERAWLAEVASVVKATADARRPYRNWLDSLSGKRKGRKVGHSRFRFRKDNRQVIWFTRNGFGVTYGGVRVAKIGSVRLRWSRELPSEPSSVTVVQETDGRYYASFVVDVAETPLLPIANDVGIDLGLASLAVLSTDGAIDNPGHLQRKARALARAQKGLCGKTKGSNRRAKAVRRVAVQQRKVRQTRMNGHHKLAHRIVRDNQAIYLEDLAVSVLARTRLAKSVHDVGWSMLVRLLEEKARRCHRRVVKVSRPFPSSHLCSACGFNSGKKPLEVRSWTCASCGSARDRDLFAAKNIRAQGRQVAAGLAETQNARGGCVRLGLVPATACEARTRRGAT
jgi:putative transposase